MDRQMDGRTDRDTQREKDRDRQIDRQTDSHTNSESLSLSLSLSLPLTNSDVQRPAVLLRVFPQPRDGVGKVRGEWSIHQWLQSAEVNFYQLVIAAALVRSQQMRVALSLLCNG